jgi:Mlc titration factor MtfA (ptsG expression regulator)
MFWLKQRKRRRLRMTSFPPSWLEIIRRNVPYIHILPKDDRNELQGHIHVFLAEKNFEGCGGIQVTDEIQVTIAAQACLLLLHRVTDYFPLLRSVLIYPGAYIAPVTESIGHGVVSEGVSVRVGESWQHGSVILSWDDVLHGASNIHDGHNVVLHEFAHQLDQEAGAAEGAPILPEQSMYGEWARVFSAEYSQLQEDADLGRETIVDKYGAVNPAEFFAVATECFFEKALQFKEKHPELYEELRLFYCQDPARFYWHLD